MLNKPPKSAARAAISESLLAVRLPKETYRELHRIRTILGIPVSRLVRDALSMYLTVSNYELILEEHQKAGRVYTHEQLMALQNKSADATDHAA